MLTLAVSQCAMCIFHKVRHPYNRQKQPQYERTSKLEKVFTVTKVHNSRISDLSEATLKTHTLCNEKTRTNAYFLKIPSYTHLLRPGQFNISAFVVSRVLFGVSEFTKGRHSLGDSHCAMCIFYIPSPMWREFIFGSKLTDLPSNGPHP